MMRYCTTLIFTLITLRDGLPILLKADFERSMIRPFCKWPTIINLNNLIKNQTKTIDLFELKTTIERETCQE